MPRVLLPLALLLVAFWIYSIVDCAMVHPSRHRGVSKPVWIVIVVLLPVIGGLLWFIVGRSRPQTRPKIAAPDDNPAFLGSIGSIADQDERIRRLEEELAALDAEDTRAPDGDAKPSAADAAQDTTDDNANGDAADGGAERDARS